jgi:hypothetical protein
MENNKEQSGFKDLLNSLMEKRWYVTAIVLGLFVLILLGIFVAIATGTAMAAEWKELLLLLLGAFIGSYGKIIDYYYSDADKDKMLVQKMDEEDGVTLSHTNDMKETNKVPTPIIPDAFIQGAAAARDLAVTENRQNFELKKDEQEHRQEMEKLEFEYHAHRQCEHVWGDSDGDGELECQKCGLLKDK